MCFLGRSDPGVSCITGRDLRDHHLLQPPPLPDQETKHFPVRKWLSQPGTWTQPLTAGKELKLRVPAAQWGAGGVCLTSSASFRLSGGDYLPIQNQGTMPHLSNPLPLSGSGGTWLLGREGGHSGREGLSWYEDGAAGELTHRAPPAPAWFHQPQPLGKPHPRKSLESLGQWVGWKLRENEKGTTYGFLVSGSVSPPFLPHPCCPDDPTLQGSCEARGDTAHLEQALSLGDSQEPIVIHQGRGPPCEMDLGQSYLDWRSGTIKESLEGPPWGPSG